MPAFSLLVATWEDGIFVVTDGAVRQELAGRAVRGLTTVRDGREAIAIVDGGSLRRRSSDGHWTEFARTEPNLSCYVAIEDVIFAGTDDARILRVHVDGSQHYLSAFETVPGRDSWYSGAALVDGKLLGPPLGVRSMAATCDGAVLLANVHVGGIARSTDLGLTWRPTIDIESDVHEVCVHPSQPGMVCAAAAVGLCTSTDMGMTWTVDQRGLHAPHCSAVAFGRHDVFVSASVDPFSDEGAVYRRPIGSDEPLQPIGGGMPKKTGGKVDTNCMATRHAVVACVDAAGTVYVSEDDGASWSTPVDGLPFASGLRLLPA